MKENKKDNTNLIRTLEFIGTVVIPALTLALTGTIKYLKNNEENKNTAG